MDTFNNLPVCGLLLLALATLYGSVPAVAGQTTLVADSIYDPVAVLEPDLPPFLNQDHPDGPGFGYAVAVHGDTLVVGAPRTRVHENFETGGAAFIFERVGGQWTLSQRFPFDFITLPGNHHCGHAVAVDPYNVLIGCPNRAGQSGATVLLTRPAAGAPFELANSDFNPGSEVGDRCGHSVDLLGNGDSGTYPLAAIGCPGQQIGGSLAGPNGVISSGGVNLQFYCPPFAPCAGVLGVGWHPLESFNGTQGARGAEPAVGFGSSLRLVPYFGSHIVLAAGAPATGPNLHGRVDIHRATIDDLQNWTLDHTLTGESGSELGTSVDLGSSNSLLRVVAGAPGHFDAKSEFRTGGVLVTSRSLVGWSASTVILGEPSGGQFLQNRLGQSVALLSPHTQPDLAAGAPLWPGDEARGRVLRYQRSDTGDWLPTVDEPFQLETFPADSQTGQALGAHGPWLAAGAPGHPDDSGSPQGRVFLYVRGDRLFADRFEETPD